MKEIGCDSCIGHGRDSFRSLFIGAWLGNLFDRKTGFDRRIQPLRQRSMKAWHFKFFQSGFHGSRSR